MLAFAGAFVAAIGTLSYLPQGSVETPDKEVTSWREGVNHMISKGKIVVGMTKDQVRAAWGEPGWVIMPQGSRRGDEEWLVMVDGNFIELSFEKGILRSVNLSRNVTP